ncbi:hypothetical protein [Catellatospora methionotrophica]|uniref:hypothetical protein n=1 Tax=Catellatospora methionotrophica TaxID=121620 RepID=UPI0033C3C56E
MPMLEHAVTSAVGELLTLSSEDDEDRWWHLVQWLRGHGGRHALDWPADDPGADLPGELVAALACYPADRQGG